MKKLSSTETHPETQNREAVLQRLRQRFAHLPAEVSLADELISERRAEARRSESE